MIRAIKKIFKKKHKPEDTLYRVIDDLLDEKERMKNILEIIYRIEIDCVDHTLSKPVGRVLNLCTLQLYDSR